MSEQTAYTVLTYPLAVETLWKLAKENPDLVYTKTPEYLLSRQCVNYTNDGEPSCIIGHVIYRIYGNETLLSLNQYADAKIAIGDAGIVATPHARKLLKIVQSLQDDGTPWGVAVTQAIERVEPDYLKNMKSMVTDEDT